MFVKGRKKAMKEVIKVRGSNVGEKEATKKSMRQ